MAKVDIERSTIDTKSKSKIKGSSAVDSKRFLKSNDSLIQGTYFRLGYVKVP